MTSMKRTQGGGNGTGSTPSSTGISRISSSLWNQKDDIMHPMSFVAVLSIPGVHSHE